MWRIPQSVQLPVPALLFPASACRLIPPITVFTTAFPSIIPWSDFIWDSLFHKIIQEQSSYICTYIHEKNPQWFPNISLTSLVTVFFICLCASSFQWCYWKVWPGVQYILTLQKLQKNCVALSLSQYTFVCQERFGICLLLQFLPCHPGTYLTS